MADSPQYIHLTDVSNLDHAFASARHCVRGMTNVAAILQTPNVRKREVERLRREVALLVNYGQQLERHLFNGGTLPIFQRLSNEVRVAGHVASCYHLGISNVVKRLLWTVDSATRWGFPGYSERQLLEGEWRPPPINAQNVKGVIRALSFVDVVELDALPFDLERERDAAAKTVISYPEYKQLRGIVYESPSKPGSASMQRKPRTEPVTAGPTIEYGFSADGQLEHWVREGDGVARPATAAELALSDAQASEAAKRAMEARSAFVDQIAAGTPDLTRRYCEYVGKIKGVVPAGLTRLDLEILAAEHVRLLNSQQQSAQPAAHPETSTIDSKESPEVERIFNGKPSTGTIASGKESPTRRAPPADEPSLFDAPALPDQGNDPTAEHVQQKSDAIEWSKPIFLKDLRESLGVSHNTLMSRIERREIVVDRTGKARKVRVAIDCLPKHLQTKFGRNSL